MAPLVRKAFKDPLVRRAFKDLLAQQESKAPLATRDHKVLLDHKEYKVRPVRQATPDRKVSKVLLDLLDHRVRQRD